MIEDVGMTKPKSIKQSRDSQGWIQVGVDGVTTPPYNLSCFNIVLIYVNFLNTSLAATLLEAMFILINLQLGVVELSEL